MTKTNIKDKTGKSLLKTKIKDKIGKSLFMAAAVICVISVVTIFIFLIVKSVPALHKIGFFDFLFGSEWARIVVESV